MSADEDIGREVGRLVLIGLALLIGGVLLGVWAFHHFRYAP
jgi:hypothetical protein